MNTNKGKRKEGKACDGKNGNKLVMKKTKSKTEKKRKGGTDKERNRSWRKGERRPGRKTRVENRTGALREMLGCS